MDRTCECVTTTELGLFMRTIPPFIYFPPWLEYIVAKYIEFDLFTMIIPIHGPRNEIGLFGTNMDSTQTLYTLDPLCGDLYRAFTIICGPSLGDDRIVVKCGGYSYENRISSKSVRYFRCSSRQWIDCEPMAVGRCGHAVALHNGRIYAIGGRTFINGRSNRLLCVESFEIQDNSVHNEQKTVSSGCGPIAPMTRHYYRSKAVSCGERLIVWGAGNERLNRYGTGECYDSIKNVWTPVADLPVASEVRQNLCAISSDIILGILSATPFLYSVSKNKWTAAKWELPSIGFSAVNANNPRDFLTLITRDRLGGCMTWFLPLSLALSEEPEEVRKAWIMGPRNESHFTVI